jgi:serine phosphatase RsbU (regulator of sigma subunit)
MMAARSGHREREPRAALERAGEALEALAEAGVGVASARGIADALGAIAEAAARGAGAEVTVLRVVDDERRYLIACAVASASSAVAAELEGTRVPIDELSPDEVDSLEHLPAAVARAARRAPATAVLQLPVAICDEVDGSLELLRAGPRFDESERRVARLAAAQAALVIRAFGKNGAARGPDAGETLTLAGEALEAGADEAQTADQVVRLAAEATGALSGLLWRAEEGQELQLVSSFCLTAMNTELVDARDVAEQALGGRTPVSIEALEGRSPGGAEVFATLQLGHPPVGVLQLLFPAAREPSETELSQLATFGVRAAHALRAGARTRTMAAELERTRALLGVVGQAISQLSLAHTLETAVARVGELLEVDRLAVYLRDDEQLYAAAGIGLAGPHARLAERLLELALGPFRGRGMLIVEDVRVDPRLAAVSDAAAEAGIDTAAAVPLLVRDDPIGLLAVFPRHGRVLTENESALLSALAAQLAVAVQNAQLHEETKRLGEDRERALDAERASAKQLGALYEISRSFAQSLSLEATLAAVTHTITDVLDVDVALIGMPDDRREVLIPRAMRVVDERVEEAVRAIVWQPLPFGAHPVQRLFRLAEPFMLSRRTLEQIGEPATRLLPFLEHGWTGGVAPIATAAEVLASLTVLSLRPETPVTEQTLEQVEAIGGQAALAIDNARLYQQQKEFADTMQRSLLPRTLPKLRGLELGDAYQSSARVEVGGDVYDFVELEDGRLAAVLGDVTGHGIEAAADMAMAKFVFRSLAREHPEPGDFLKSANDVVVGEIAPGKFITMVYLLVDGSNGEVAGAGAGHPPPRVVTPDGVVRSLDVQGLVLGIEAGEEYEEVREPLEVGGAVVLYTDGVLEARRGGELYGFERLDAIVSAGRELSAQDLAETVLADCRDFANNELADDCAVVVIKRVN